MSESASSDPLHLIGTLPIEGFLYGLRHPAILAGVALGDNRGKHWLDTAEAIFAGALTTNGFEPGRPLLWTPSLTHSVETLLNDVYRMQVAAGAPIATLGRIIGVRKSQITIAIPILAFSYAVTNQAIAWLVDLFGLVAAGADTLSHTNKLAACIGAMNQDTLITSNGIRFLRAAEKLDVPVCEISGGVFQFGAGKNASWLEGSFTEQTPCIGVALARNKARAATILRRSGIPVPEHIRVQSLDAAVKAADTLGYPVVVKPADMDGGLAVSTDLTTIEEVQQAFTRAASHSTNVLVERHCQGIDHRMVVFRSELVWASARVPGGVVGDGKSSISVLVERRNFSISRGSVIAGRYPLYIDDEAHELLRKIGLTLDSIPQNGQYIRLRRAYSLLTGGTASPAFEKVHPDNAQLAIRAAEALRLDLAGVDFLIKDISRSWREIGAVVCEINGRPDLGTSGPHIYAEILKKICNGDGRIPIIVVLGDLPSNNLAKEIARGLFLAGWTVGLSDSSGVVIDNEVLSTSCEALISSRMLMMNREVDIIVFEITNAEFIRSGLGFDSFDYLVLAGEYMEELDEDAISSDLFIVSSGAIMPMCRTHVLHVPGINRNLIDNIMRDERLIINEVEYENIVASLVAKVAEYKR